jgi:pyruvate ferredoxin oxidoreductase alpha subunit
VIVPEAKAVRRLIKPFDPGPLKFRASHPVSQAVAVLGGSPYSYFRYEMHLAALNGLKVYDELAEEFAREFGREHPAVEAYRADDAEVVFFMMGSYATKAKAAVDRLREAGEKIGLVRPRLLRPYPEARLREILAGKRGVAVIDQNLSLGKGGILFAELTSVLYGLQHPPILTSFIGGLGGRDISPEELYEMAAVTRQATQTGIAPPPRLLYTEAELREVRKLQAIAHVERHKLGDEKK